MLAATLTPGRPPPQRLSLVLSGQLAILNSRLCISTPRLPGSLQGSFRCELHQVALPDALGKDSSRLSQGRGEPGDESQDGDGDRLPSRITPSLGAWRVVTLLPCCHCCCSSPRSMASWAEATKPSTSPAFHTAERPAAWLGQKRPPSWQTRAAIQRQCTTFPKQS